MEYEKTVEDEKMRPMTSAGQSMTSAGREGGRRVLLNRAGRLRRKAEMLEALARAIPENFPLDADQGLWELAINDRD